MRIVKEANERRNEILDVADELFAQKGYDKTSTTDILEKVGIARGTLYYHFKSKEDIMNALIERYHARVFDTAQKIAIDKSISVKERIILVVMALDISKGNGNKIIEHIHQPQNALMHQKIKEVILSSVTPILTGIIREGIEQGLFNTSYPYECMEMILVYTNTVFDNGMMIMTAEQRRLRVEAFIYNVERLLGAESGSLMYVMKLIENED